jgi:nitrate reductase molybdenum cofactor assembly chaperone NarJ/NarW
MSSYAALAPLFRYPDAAYPQRMRDAGAGTLDLAAWQTAYTSTFDLTPSCSPYLGVHLFGDENRDRARLMVGLRQSYTRAGMAVNHGELPDHIAEVLDFVDRAPGDEREDLLRLVVVPALQKMDEILRPTSNPYRHLVSAALSLSGGES